MDDMALLYPDAATLNRWRAAIEKYLNEVLHLELNSKTTIGLVKQGSPSWAAESIRGTANRPLSRSRK